jgi:hypothetical protein
MGEIYDPFVVHLWAIYDIAWLKETQQGVSICIVEIYKYEDLGPQFENSKITDSGHVSDPR